MSSNGRNPELMRRLMQQECAIAEAIVLNKRLCDYLQNRLRQLQMRSRNYQQTGSGMQQYPSTNHQDTCGRILTGTGQFNRASVEPSPIGPNNGTGYYSPSSGQSEGSNRPPPSPSSDLNRTGYYSPPCSPRSETGARDMIPRPLPADLGRTVSSHPDPGTNQSNQFEVFHSPFARPNTCTMVCPVCQTTFDVQLRPAQNSMF